VRARALSSIYALIAADKSRSTCVTVVTVVDLDSARVILTSGRVARSSRAIFREIERKVPGTVCVILRVRNSDRCWMKQLLAHREKRDREGAARCDARSRTKGKTNRIPLRMTAVRGTVRVSRRHDGHDVSLLILFLFYARHVRNQFPTLLRRARLGVVLQFINYVRSAVDICIRFG